jgi:hypothetical protein
MPNDKIMKMHFGNWIVVAFVFFALFIGTLVTVCVRQDISLVSQSYYNDELDYQEQIKRIKNTNGLLVKPVIHRSPDGSLEIRFDAQQKIAKGRVNLFCPSDPGSDKEFQFKSSLTTQQFDISTFKKGMYKAKLLWVMDGEEYYYEEIINI